MASTLDNFARAGDDLAPGARAALGDAASQLSRIGADTAAGAANAARSAATMADNAAAISKTLTDAGQQGLVRSMDDVTSVLDDGLKKAVDDVPTGPAAAAETNALRNAANAIGDAAESIKLKFSFPSGKTIAGLAVAGYCIYALASLFDTDGQTIDITNITPISATQIKIDYNPPPGKLAFALRIGDTLTFSGCQTGCIVPALGTEQVVRLVGDTSCIINKSVSSVGGVPYPPPAPSPSGSTSGPASTPVPPPSGTAYWGRAVAHSSLTNQFVGSVADVAAAVFAAAGAGVGAAIGGAVEGLGQGLGIPPGGGPGGPLCNVPLVGGVLCGGPGGGGVCSLPIVSSICGLGQTFKTIIMIICFIISLSISAYIAYKIASG